MRRLLAEAAAEADVELAVGAALLLGLEPGACPEVGIAAWCASQATPDDALAAQYSEAVRVDPRLDDVLPDGWPLAVLPPTRWPRPTDTRGMAVGLSSAADGDLHVWVGEGPALPGEYVAQRAFLDLGAYEIPVVWHDRSTPTFSADTSAPGQWACGIDTLGGLRCAGDAPVAQDVPIGTGFVDVDATADHACAIHRDGYAQCWGGTSERIDGVFDVWVGETGRCFLLDMGVIQCGGRAAPTVTPWPLPLRPSNVLGLLSQHRQGHTAP